VLAGFVGAVLWLPFAIVLRKTGSYFIAAAVFIVFEIIKSRYICGGLPWLNIAQTQYNNRLAVQIVSLIGEYGLSFIVVMISLYLQKAVFERKIKDWAVAGGLTLMLFGFGALRLAAYELPVGEYTARMVQTGLNQADKWDRSKRGAVLSKMMNDAKTATGAPGDYDFLIFPETTFPINPFTNPAILGILNNGKPVILGYDRAEFDGSGQKKLYNSAVISLEGKILQRYDKTKLAPFGEYFPMERLLKPVKKYFFGNASLFTPGEEQVLMNYDKLKMVPLICYESAFSEIVRSGVELGGNALVIISNDSWFGDTVGRMQNLAIVMLHATEYNKFALRVTQDGISAAVGPTGKAITILKEKEFAYEDINFSPLFKNTVFYEIEYLWFYILIVAYLIRFKYLRKRKNL
jgi:apolipoprotein N-acyltransferase